MIELFAIFDEFIFYLLIRLVVYSVRLHYQPVSSL